MNQRPTIFPSFRKKDVEAVKLSVVPPLPNAIAQKQKMIYGVKFQVAQKEISCWSFLDVKVEISHIIVFSVSLSLPYSRLPFQFFSSA